MKVGDLVTVRPAEEGLYVITSFYSIDTAILVSQQEPMHGTRLMNIQWIEVISESK